MLKLIPTSAPDVYRVEGARPTLAATQRAIEVLLDDEWPCPMMTYNATRYSVTVRYGRKSRRVYTRICLS